MIVTISGSKAEALIAGWNDILKVAKGEQRSLSNYTVQVREEDDKFIVTFSGVPRKGEFSMGAIQPHAYGAIITLEKRTLRVLKRTIPQ